MNADRLFFTGMAAAMLVTVFVGFAPTYYLLPWLQGVTTRGVAGGASLTPLVHLHAVLFSIWILVFLAQTGLIAARRTDVHRVSGLVAVLLAPTVLVVGILTAIESGRRGNTPPGWPNDEVFLLVPFTSLALFAGFIAAGYVERRRPDYHKRLMLLATMAMLVPALARITRMIQLPFLPPGVRGGLILLNLYLAALVIFDWVRRGRLHPVTMWGVVVYLATWPARLTLGYTEPWQAFAGSLLN